MNSTHDLKSAGLKATLPRIKIINLFETSKVRHLTAEDVYKQLLTEGLDIGLAPAQDRARPRLRDQRARALSVCRVHQAALSAPQGRRHVAIGHDTDRGRAITPFRGD